jgi:hypothetical protein
MTDQALKYRWFDIFGSTHNRCIVSFLIANRRKSRMHITNELSRLCRFKFPFTIGLYSVSQLLERLIRTDPVRLF